jgi:hypothetical protein
MAFQAFFQRLFKSFASIIEDLLILSGLGFVIYATFLVNQIAGFYCAGACLFGLGAWITAHPKRK